MKSLRTLATIAALMFTPLAVNATVIFDFVCDDPTCGGDPLWGGFIEFIDAAVATGSAQGPGDILDFAFFTDDKGGLEWFLGGYVGGAGHSLGGLTVLFDAGHSTITYADAGGSCRNPVFSPCVAQNSTAGADTLFWNASGVLDVNHDFQAGTWVARSAVPEPPTLALLGFGLLGLAARARSRSA